MPPKIVLFGSESTGKTTLAQQLAEHYQTVWVPEFSRQYQEQKGRPLELADVVPVAMGQLAREQEKLPHANRILICDTDILETKVYSEVYFGTCPEWLLGRIPQHLADLYLLTDIDIPWEPDGIRDQPHQRAAIHAKFKHELLMRCVRFTEINGPFPKRLHEAQQAIGAFLREKQLR